MFAVLLVACSSGSTDEPAPDNNADEAAAKACRGNGRVVPIAEIESSLRASGFPDTEIPKMVCVAKWESSFCERAINTNKNGSIDRGLFQVNSIHLGDPGCPKSGDGDTLFDAHVNTKCAHFIWKAQGIKAWYGYQKHRAECDAYTLND
jgi:hypothetical protein